MIDGIRLTICPQYYVTRIAMIYKRHGRNGWGYDCNNY